MQLCPSESAKPIANWPPYNVWSSSPTYTTNAQTIHNPSINNPSPNRTTKANPHPISSALTTLVASVESPNRWNSIRYRTKGAAMIPPTGGKIKVPCLRVNDEQGKSTWMYESSDIIEYLQTRYA